MYPDNKNLRVTFMGTNPQGYKNLMKTNENAPIIVEELGKAFKAQILNQKTEKISTTHDVSDMKKEMAKALKKNAQKKANRESRNFECASLDWKTIEKLSGSPVKVDQKKKKNKCRLEIRKSLNLQISTRQYSDRAEFEEWAIGHFKNRNWTEGPNFDRAYAMTNKMIFNGWYRFENGNGFTVIITNFHPTQIGKKPEVLEKEYLPYFDALIEIMGKSIGGR